MHRRKQTPKEDIEKIFAATPVVTFALLSVSLTDASGTNWLSKLVSAARSKSAQQKLWGMAELFFQQTAARHACGSSKCLDSVRIIHNPSGAAADWTLCCVRSLGNVFCST
ncbi:hypothetical protein WJX82_009536 [Trebouxia sp. C0006]